MSRPKIHCQVCGTEGDPQVIEAMSQNEWEFWTLHRIENKGGIVQVLACPNCNTATHSLILESYMERIRLGLVPGFH